MNDQRAALNASRLMKSYAVLIFSVLLLVLLANYYQVLVVAPDKIDMEAFNRALISSVGFWIDIARFIFGLLVIHFVWLLALWLTTVGWLVKIRITCREQRLIQWFFFLLSMFLVTIWSNRIYPNMQGSGFLKHSPFLFSDIVFYLTLFILVASSIVSLYYFSRGHAKAFGIVLVVTIGFGLLSMSFSSATVEVGSSNNSQPNIFIIGVDSLRPDQTGYFGNEGELTPNIDRFLAQSAVYESAYTPYARTFPAWMSILTGQEPVNHKGRYNLINHSHINKEANLANWLKGSDYRTIYAFDERRFNSIDESFGFDTVVGPDYGALGFVLGGFDHPIVNLICNTKVGKWLFPMMYLNRGRDGNYDPEKYSQAILDAVEAENEQPIFLAAHFLLPHWPWLSRDWEWLDKFEYSELPSRQALYRYRMMLKQADRQFGAFIEGLEKTGALDNAYVFFVSDHGDGFQMDEDNVQPGTEDRDYDIFANTRGHATNVLNTGQYRVVLAARAYGQEGFLSGMRQGNASLMDIVPTVSELLGGKLSVKGVDGISLVSSTPKELNDRVLFMETGFVVLELTEEEIDQKRVISETIGAYSVDSAGKVVVREDFEEMIVKGKHRAALLGDWQLTMIPSLGKRLVLSNVKQKKWWPASKYEGEADWGRMLSEMCEHYKDDVGFDPAGLCLAQGGASEVAIYR